MNQGAVERAKRIKVIILDVDGVLTDGKLGYSSSDMIKFFNIKDGHAIKMAMRAGLLVGIMTGRSDDVTRKRAEELNMSFVYEGAIDKKNTFEQLLKDKGVNAEECLYVGDDVIDIPVIIRCGIGACVAEAVEEVKECSDWQSTLPGGQGAVREIIGRLLKEQGAWDQAMERYLR